MARVILGISPGTRVIGLAVIRNGELIEWKVKTFKEKWSWEKRRQILATIARICEYHSVTTLVLKKVDPLRSSRQLDKLIVAILRQAERNQIKTVKYSLADLDYDLQTGKKQTKDNVASQVADKHPELRKDYLRARNSNKEYHMKMFEAVAMAEQFRDR
ncbi:MAG: hypothetical protein JWQ38_468 [Flavipsychrobacter sp.]|nr:hypothetical protein [Flavipsychrobacter sp.]